MKLFYRKFGDGPPLIILHGLYGSSDNWVTIAKKLSDTFTVYLPDQRNHGQSPHSDIHDYDSMRDDLFELVTDLRLRKFFLAGHSMGGKTAIAFAAAWPEMIEGLLIADISPFTNETSQISAYNQHLTILKTILGMDLSKIRSRAEAESLIMEKISSEKTRGFILKNLQRNPGDIFSWKLNASSLYKNLDKIMAGIDLEAGLSEPITGFPVIFLKGSNSSYLTASSVADIRKVFPASEFIVINGAGHWIHADKPDEVAANLRRLLTD
ncbi:MAG: alpha/beta fold hydrolase [Bacteroidales bacterium]|nr:alpha/beta fold hydrolase [Bacteroidales bacterium]